MGPLLVGAAGLMWGHVVVAGPGPGGGLGALRLPPWGTAERGRQLRRVAPAAAPGVKLVDDMAAEDAHERFPMPMDTSDQDLIWVGRVRRDISNPEAARGITFWCCGDQIRKGAATNAVQIAQLLCE